MNQSSRRRHHESLLSARLGVPPQLLALHVLDQTDKGTSRHRRPNISRTSHFGHGEGAFQHGTNERNRRRPANHRHIVDLRQIHSCFLDALLRNLNRLLNLIANHVFKLGACDFDGNVFIFELHFHFLDRDGRKVRLDLLARRVNRRLLLHRKLALRVRHSLANALDNHAVEDVVERRSSEVGVASQSNHVVLLILDLHQRHIKGAAAQIEHDQCLVLQVVFHGECNGSRRRLVHQENALGSLVELNGLDRGKALVGVEKRRNRNDDLVDWVTRLLFGESAKVVDEVRSHLLRIDHRLFSLHSELVSSSVLLPFNNSERPIRNETLNNGIIEILRHNTLRLVNRIRFSRNLLLLRRRSHQDRISIRYHGRDVGTSIFIFQYLQIAFGVDAARGRIGCS